MQADASKRQTTLDCMGKLKREKRRLFERFHHHTKHHIFNKNKAQLFSTFIDTDQQGGKIFIPKKYRQKTMPSITNEEVIKIKQKEALQKMRLDIECMKTYATSHNEQATEFERLIKSEIDSLEADGETKHATIHLVQDHLENLKRMSAEEWTKKESFFLKLQKEYLENEIEKKPVASTQEEEDKITQFLLELGEDAPVPQQVPKLKEKAIKPHVTNQQQKTVHSNGDKSRKQKNHRNRKQSRNDDISKSLKNRDRIQSSSSYHSPTRSKNRRENSYSSDSSPERESIKRTKNKSHKSRRPPVDRNMSYNRPQYRERNRNPNYQENSYYNPDMNFPANFLANLLASSMIR